MTYAFDPATGVERWRFATNHGAVGSPVVTDTAVLQPTSDGVVTALAPDTGHRIWEGSVADSAIFGLAASSDVIIATHTGSSPGVAALETDTDRRHWRTSPARPRPTPAGSCCCGSPRRSRSSASCS